MHRSSLLVISFLIASLLLTACGSDSTLPTLRPTVDSGNDTQPTVDPNLGSGFDPDLGNDDTTTSPEPTPTQESGSSVGGDNESGARGIGFTAQITGGSVADINDGGQYGCNLNGHRISSGTSPAPNITFIVPTSGVIDTHTLSSDSPIAVQVSLASIDDSYTQLTGGTLTIDRVPASAGEFVSGSFDFTIRNASGSEIGIRGSFDFETGNTAYC
jgi:hypothetical protein